MMKKVNDYMVVKVIDDCDYELYAIALFKNKSDFEKAKEAVAKLREDEDGYLDGLNSPIEAIEKFAVDVIEVNAGYDEMLI